MCSLNTFSVQDSLLLQSTLMSARCLIKVQHLQRAELHKCLDYQWEWQSVDGCQSEVTTNHFTFGLNSALCYSQENRLGQFDHGDVSPVSELLDNPPIPVFTTDCTSGF